MGVRAEDLWPAMEAADAQWLAAFNTPNPAAFVSLWVTAERGEPSDPGPPIQDSVSSPMNFITNRAPSSRFVQEVHLDQASVPQLHTVRYRGDCEETAMTYTDNREIAEDLQAAPVSRARMDLLWLDPETLSLLKAATESRTTRYLLVINKYILRIRGLGVAGGLYESVLTGVIRGKIKSDDLKWALKVDEIAAEAEAASKAGDYGTAIDYYRTALRSAPGCDLYLMSIGSCYGLLGKNELAVRYLGRAAQINPTNPRIAQNLAAARSNHEA
jgi:tetratricopeptide (TPR) repeat protein